MKNNKTNTLLFNMMKKEYYKNLKQGNMSKTIFVLLLCCLFLFMNKNQKAQNTYYFDEGTNVGNSFGETPYLADYTDFKSQMLILADELLEAGMLPGEIINEICIPANSWNSNNLYGKFCFTTADDLSYDFVFSPNYYFSCDYNAQGITIENTYNPIIWDGTSNLVVEIIRDGNYSYDNNATVSYSITDFKSMRSLAFDDPYYEYYRDNMHTYDDGDSYYTRPNIIIKTSYKGTQSEVVIGEMNTTSSSSSLGPNPFGCDDHDTKTQILITADELVNEGVGPGIITSVSFKLKNKDLYNDGRYLSIYVKIKTTNSNSLSLFELDGFTNLESRSFSVFDYSTDPWVKFENVNSNCAWDGTTNLLVDINGYGKDTEFDTYDGCRNNNSQLCPSVFTIEPTSYTSVIYNYGYIECCDNNYNSNENIYERCLDECYDEDGDPYYCYDENNIREEFINYDEPGIPSSTRPLMKISGAFDPDRQKLLELAEAIGADEALEWSHSQNSSFWPNITKNSAGYVTHIDFSNLGLSGTIPAVIGEFTQLQSFNISGNDFWGDLPAEIFQVPTLTELNASNNNFTSIPDITTSTATINVSNNRLDFEDILPNINTTAVFTYAPQKELIGETEYWVDECSAFSMTLPISDDPNNTYQWYHNGSPVSTDMVYTDPDVILRSEDGIYYCEMSNAEIDATGQTLLLRTMDITVNVNSSPLVSFYYAAGGDNWTNTTNNTDKWLQNADYESWYGVDLDEYGNVIRISLSGNNLNGSIHPEIEQLSFLQELDLSDNPNLYGDIPTEIYQLIELRILNLNYCNFSGSLTDDINYLFNLEELKIAENSGMAGTHLPVGLEACHSLREVDVSFIGLNGSIPFNPTDHPSLQVLLLQNNNFEQLEDLSSISSLTELWVANNKLTFDDLQPNFEFKFNDDLTRYCPQKEITGLQNVDGLAEGLIEYNPFTYPVNEVDVNGNNRYQWYHGGTLFGDVQTQGDLNIPVLHKTEHEGEYRLHVTNIGLEVNDVYCEILYNPFSINNIQSNPTGICSADKAALEAIYYATDGEYWDYDANWATDASPWYNVTVVDGRVTGLDLSGNNLTQALPDELGDLTALIELDLSNNPGLGGSAIPQTVANLSQLQVLNLSGNNHSGAIPSGINALTNLREIRLNDNPSMGGFINTSYDDLAQLEILDFSNMDLSGTLPDELFDIATLRELKLSNNDFTGPLPEAVSAATVLEVLDVSNNGLSGAVPASLAGLVNMTEINLSGNNFNDLPDLSGLVNLSSLDVDNNYFNFGDLIQNVTTFQSVNDYSPQKTIPLQDNEVSFNFCETGLYAYTEIIDANGALFRWYTNDGTPVSDAIASSDMDFYDEGEYYCHVTNEVALSGLTLKYGPLQVSAEITIGDVDCDGQILAFDGSMVLLRIVYGVDGTPPNTWGLWPWASWRDGAAQAELGLEVDVMDVSAILKYVIRDVYELPTDLSSGKSGSKDLVSIVFDGEYIQLLSNGGLLGFGLEIPEGGKSLLGVPEILVEDVLYSQHISDSAYKAALATAHELPSGKPFMRIPVKSHSGSVRLMMDVNNLQQTETVDLQHTSIISSSGNTEMMCYPNPFSDKVVFVPAESNTGGQLRIYDAAGKMLQLIQPDEGKHGVQFQWDGYTSAGMKVLPGLYFYTYTTNLKVISGKLIYSK